MTNRKASVGLSLSHDGGASIVGSNPEVIAISEERMTESKHCRGYLASLVECLKSGSIPLSDCSTVVFVNDGIPLQSGYSDAIKMLNTHRLSTHAMSHHLAHASHAFYSSSFESAAIMIIDGEGNTGEKESYYLGKGNNIEKIFNKVDTSKTLGIGRTYEAFTNLLGLTYQEAAQTMALAPYGNPDRFKHGELFKIKDQMFVESALIARHFDNSVFESRGESLASLQKDLFKYKYAPTAADHLRTLEPSIDLLNISIHDQIAADIAVYIQRQLENVLIQLVRNFTKLTKKRRLCFAGGVALNVAANKAVLDETDIELIHIPPAANDRGLPLGAALYGYHHYMKKTARIRIKDDYLGACYKEDAILAAIDVMALKYPQIMSLLDIKTCDNLPREIAKLVSEDNIVGLYYGRSEFGPRALGHRSILADPRRSEVAKRLSATVKQREAFRPYAASILLNEASNWFDFEGESPFMLYTARIKSHMSTRVPAILHIDNTCRIQTINSDYCPMYTDIVKEFMLITGVPMVLNTSFNMRGSPMVETPMHAIMSFCQTGMNALALGNRTILLKKDEMREKCI